MISVFFVGGKAAEPLHEFTTFNVDKSIKDMAGEMCDGELLMKKSGVARFCCK